MSAERTRATEVGQRSDERILAVWDGGVAARSCQAGDVVVLGRGADCTLQLDHASVSRRHAVLTLDERGWSIEDLGSQNGTWFGNERVEQGRVVRSSNSVSVRLGDALVFVQRSERPSKLLRRGTLEGELTRLLDFIAVGDVPVHLFGEAGTGKRTLAKRVHEASPRRAGPIVCVNCAGLWEGTGKPETAALDVAPPEVPQREPMFVAAAGGSLVLENVGELCRASQTRLLRALQREEGAVDGQGRPARRSVRVLSSSQEDLAGRVRAGSFRADLYYRLAGYSVLVPPLRARLQELEAVALHFAEEVSEAYGLATPTFTTDAVVALKKYPWPGNFRELRHAIECAVLLAVDGVIRSSFVARRSTAGSPSEATTALSSATGTGGPVKLRGELSAIERRRILEALERCGGNQTRVAQMLGMGRRTLLKRLDEYQIVRPRRKNRSAD